MLYNFSKVSDFHNQKIIAITDWEQQYYQQTIIELMHVDMYVRQEKI